MLEPGVDNTFLDRAFRIARLEANCAAIRGTLFGSEDGYKLPDDVSL
ncbi:hypothetical protein ACFQL7_26905 [Halocatena marina]|uniref:Uncharacterized protein n=1 Tax=Halocatena marina TaxID=2934937 RepID=A0ABD5YUZ1_9EURY